MKACFYNCLLLLTLFGIAWGCKKEVATLKCAEGMVIGPGCLVGAYIIRLDQKNREYGIRETAIFDKEVEVMNLPEKYKIRGTRIYFTFIKPGEEKGKYLTYCTPAPQINIVEVSSESCPARMDK